MSPLAKWLKRMGYVKLDQFGLVLTADERILSTRPAVLDDGLGGKIVGWKDGDLAAMELDKFGAPKAVQQLAPIIKPAPIAAVAPRVAAAAPPPVPQKRMTLPGVAAYVPPIPVVAVPEPIAPTPAPEMTEDDWEWEIAVARARAAAEEAEAAKEAAKVIPISSARKASVMPVAPPPLPPVEIDDEDDWVSIRQRAEQAARIAEAATRSAARHKTPTAPPVVAKPAPIAPPVERKTVIPVPSLGTMSPGAVQPVVRARFPKGTESSQIKTDPNLSVGDKTTPNQPLPSVPRQATRG